VVTAGCAGQFQGTCSVSNMHGYMLLLLLLLVQVTFTWGTPSMTASP
jgi:hypothetical protein